MRVIRAFLATWAALAAISVASAGGLTVEVVDSNGPLPGATVTISHEAGFVKTTAVLTNTQGLAEFPVLRPGGGYTVEVQFPGFGMRRESDIRVPMSDIVAITIQLAEEITERVKVVAETRVVDLEATAQVTKFSDDFIQDLPVPGRSYQNILTLAPGVLDADGDGNPTVHGSRDRDFKAQVGGVSNVDPLTGQAMSRVNLDSIEEMEVITAGAGAEFGRAQGGFANIVQKQGTNDFEGGLNVLYSSSLFDGEGARDTNVTTSSDFETTTSAFTLAGPIVRDKLWYRLSNEWVDRQDPTNTGREIVPVTTEQLTASNAITWQASPRNKLELTYDADPSEVTNFGVSSSTPPESALRFESRSDTYKLNWSAPFSPKVLIESVLSWQELETGVFPNTVGNRNECVAPGVSSFFAFADCTNIDTNERSGSSNLTIDDRSQRLGVGTKATLFGGRFWGMSHTFKLGFQAENERYFRFQENRPQIFLFIFDPSTDPENGDEDPDPIPILATNFSIPAATNSRATGTNWGIHLIDEVKVRNNLTLNLGVRIDREEINSNGLTPFDPSAEFQDYLDALADGDTPDSAIRSSFTGYEALPEFVQQVAQATGVPRAIVLQLVSSAAQQGEFAEKKRRNENVNITNTNIAPRFSLSWDPWSNGKTKFALTAGRYYDKIFLNIPLDELTAPTTSISFNGTIVAGIDGVIPVEPRTSLNAAVNVSTVDRNLKTPYMDEWQFAVEREIFAETSIKFSYVNRKYRDQFQDKDINHLPGDFGKCRVPDLTLNDVFEDSPGCSVGAGAGCIAGLVIDPYTNEMYLDTDPGPGDGRTDDCGGETFIPGGQVQTNPFSNEQRLERPDGILDLYIQNPLWGDIFLIGNFNYADYDGYVLELNRRQYRSWQLNGSYTYSKSKGNGEDYNQLLGDDQSLGEQEVGWQSNDQRHSLKAQATTITPWGFRVGGVLSWQSGLPYSLLTRKVSFNSAPPALGNVGQSANEATTRTFFEGGQRNTERNKSYWNFDLQFTKEMNFSRGMNVQLVAKVINLFNEGTLKIFDPISDTGFQINGVNTQRYDFGRRYIFEAKIAF